ncbi:SdpI family protein [Temperatibacter marinus]|uniref:SdpI family protein n=1 Tax=Temperatibacter marinus TaxID=1456591 RepID=A0AA52EKN1_9PROT|nr:SdpI family protein [Temperatibacter marinus]WND03989.1 SdpI family protein [Temperatibacter marinus]
MLSKNYHLTFTLFALMIALTIYALGQLPAGTELPVHYNIQGEADRYAPASSALWFVIGMAAFTALLINFLPALDPRMKNVENTRPAIRGMVNGFVLFSAILHGGMVGQALGYPFEIMQSLLVAMSLMFLIMGNYISKTRSNFFIGIRTPWTLTSETVWVKTHRLAARLMVPVSMVVLILALLGYYKTLFPYLLFGMIATMLIPVIYSWFAYRAERVRDLESSGDS